jgi:hypothetical protein
MMGRWIDSGSVGQSEPFGSGAAGDKSIWRDSPASREA